MGSDRENLKPLRILGGPLKTSKRCHEPSRRAFPVCGQQNPHIAQRKLGQFKAEKRKSPISINLDLSFRVIMCHTDKAGETPACHRVAPLLMSDRQSIFGLSFPPPPLQKHTSKAESKENMAICKPPARKVQQLYLSLFLCILSG